MREEGRGGKLREAKCSVVSQQSKVAVKPQGDIC